MNERKIYTLGSKELKKFFKDNPDIANGLKGNQNYSAYLFDDRIECTNLIAAEERGYKNVSTEVFINYLKQFMKAKTNKKSAGRPKGLVPSKPKGDLTAENELLKKANQELTVKLAIAKQLGDENIQDLEKRLDLAYREQEDMLKELDKCIYATIHHCDRVESSTGKITLHDVDYCVDMIKRILNHKFGYKPKTEEL